MANSGPDADILLNLDEIVQLAMVEDYIEDVVIPGALSKYTQYISELQRERLIPEEKMESVAHDKHVTIPGASERIEFDDEKHPSVVPVKSETDAKHDVPGNIDSGDHVDKTSKINGPESHEDEHAHPCTSMCKSPAQRHEKVAVLLSELSTNIQMRQDNSTKNGNVPHGDTNGPITIETYGWLFGRNGRIVEASKDLFDANMIPPSARLHTLEMPKAASSFSCPNFTWVFGPLDEETQPQSIQKQESENVGHGGLDEVTFVKSAIFDHIVDATDVTMKIAEKKKKSAFSRFRKLFSCISSKEKNADCD